MPGTFAAMPKLAKLVISGNHIADWGGNTGFRAGSFPSHNAMANLDISGNLLTRVDARVFTSLNLRNLTELTLSRAAPSRNSSNLVVIEMNSFRGLLDLKHLMFQGSGSTCVHVAKEVKCFCADGHGPASQKASHGCVPVATKPSTPEPTGQQSKTFTNTSHVASIEFEVKTDTMKLPGNIAALSVRTCQGGVDPDTRKCLGESVLSPLCCFDGATAEMGCPATTQRNATTQTLQLCETGSGLFNHTGLMGPGVAYRLRFETNNAADKWIVGNWSSVWTVDTVPETTEPEWSDDEIGAGEGAGIAVAAIAGLSLVVLSVHSAKARQERLKPISTATFIQQFEAMKESGPVNHKL